MAKHFINLDKRQLSILFLAELKCSFKALFNNALLFVIQRCWLTWKTLGNLKKKQ